MRLGWWLPFSIVLACAGCGSTPTRYFVLQPQTTQPAAAAPSAAARPIVVRHVVIPAELDRKGYVSYGPDGALSIARSEEWGAPMGRMIQSVIAADLAADLPGRRVLAPGDPTPQAPHDTLAVTIRHFAADASGHLRLSADWTLLGPQNRAEAAASFDKIRQSSSPDAKDTVPLMSAALAELSQHIAAGISQSGEPPAQR